MENLLQVSECQRQVPMHDMGTGDGKYQFLKEKKKRENEKEKNR